jgi:hypothetical protein
VTKIPNSQPLPLPAWIQNVYLIQLPPGAKNDSLSHIVYRSASPGFAISRAAADTELVSLVALHFPFTAFKIVGLTIRLHNSNVVYEETAIFDLQIGYFPSLDYSVELVTSSSNFKHISNTFPNKSKQFLRHAPVFYL